MAGTKDSLNARENPRSDESSPPSSPASTDAGQGARALDTRENAPASSTPNARSGGSGAGTGRTARSQANSLGSSNDVDRALVQAPEASPEFDASKRASALPAQVDEREGQNPNREALSQDEAPRLLNLEAAAPRPQGDQSEESEGASPTAQVHGPELPTRGAELEAESTQVSQPVTSHEGVNLSLRAEIASLTQKTTDQEKKLTRLQTEYEKTRDKFHKLESFFNEHIVPLLERVTLLEQTAKNALNGPHEIIQEAPQEDANLLGQSSQQNLQGQGVESREQPVRADGQDEQPDALVGPNPPGEGGQWNIQGVVAREQPVRAVGQDELLGQDLNRLPLLEKDLKPLQKDLESLKEWKEKFLESFKPWKESQNNRVSKLEEHMEHSETRERELQEFSTFVTETYGGSLKKFNWWFKFQRFLLPTSQMVFSMTSHLAECGYCPKVVPIVMVSIAAGTQLVSIGTSLCYKRKATMAIPAFMERYNEEAVARMSPWRKLLQIIDSGIAEMHLAESVEHLAHFAEPVADAFTDRLREEAKWNNKSLKRRQALPAILIPTIVSLLMSIGLHWLRPLRKLYQAVKRNLAAAYRGTGRLRR